MTTPIGFSSTLPVGQYLQQTADEIVRQSQTLSMSAFMLAQWKVIDMPDGERIIALCFPSSKWTYENERLILK